MQAEKIVSMETVRVLVTYRLYAGIKNVCNICFHKVKNKKANIISNIRKFKQNFFWNLIDNIVFTQI